MVGSSECPVRWDHFRRRFGKLRSRPQRTVCILTQKPIEICTSPILNHTDEGDVIYDPFADSGVIFAALQETGCVALGVEIEPLFCEKFIARLENHYRLKAKVVGKVFAIGGNVLKPSGAG
ncbi:MAG TPA: DNA methyltransferase [Oligoflexus sp.]|uniref:DNA methyltransferase n=1 Tax=Oligoflexus sp. TaxID=1971216 RepID=UPI002D7EB23F|nr:DNA methyltransferase [Oligoflexus sp.]HET9237085.1 DNA methyltransferase [Oligoflexus sp.]